MLLGYHWSASTIWVPYQLALYWIRSSKPDIAASARALDCRPALIMPETFRVSIPRVWYLRTNLSADVVVRVIAQACYPALGAVDAALSLPPAAAAGRAAHLRPLPATQSAQCVAVGPGIGIFPAFRAFTYRLVICIRIGVFSAAVDGQRIDAHVHAAHGLVFSLGRRYGRFPAGDAGVPAAIAPAHGDLVRDAIQQRAELYPHTAQVGQPDAPVSVVVDAGHSRCGQERTGASTFLLVEYRLVGLEAFIAPAGVGVVVVPARSLGHKLADFGHEGQRRVDLLGGVELLLQFVRREPEVSVPAGLVIGHRAVVHEPGNAHAALCVAFLPAGELQLDDYCGR